MNSACEHIDISVQDAILDIVIRRPERKNAFTLAMYGAMAEALVDAGKRGDIRAVLLRGSEGAFSSGNDLEDFASKPQAFDKSHPLFCFMRALAECPLPVVAAVDGNAVGIGTTLLLHCDLIYASPKAKFKLPFVNLGLCPEYAASYLLPRMAGYAQAAELLMLGDSFDAEKAVSIGLANAVSNEPEQAARDSCLRLVKQAPKALRNTKQLMKAATQGKVDEAFYKEIDLFAKALDGAEFREAVSAFFEKREANFSDIENQE